MLRKILCIFTFDFAEHSLCCMDEFSWGISFTQLSVFHIRVKSRVLIIGITKKIETVAQLPQSSFRKCCSCGEFMLHPQNSVFECFYLLQRKRPTLHRAGLLLICFLASLEFNTRCDAKAARLKCEDVCVQA